MLEALIFTLCASTTDDACVAAAQAYYSQSGIEHLVTEKQKQLSSQHPTASVLVGYGAMFYQRQLVVHLGGGKSAALDMSKQSILFRSEF